MDEEIRTARRRALAALGRRDRSRHELGDILKRKGVSSQMVLRVLDTLAGEGWLDDRRFAAEFVLARARRGYGRERVRAELAARGVAEEDASAALRDGYPAEEEGGCALLAARKKEKTLARAGRRGEAALARFLRGRGFSSGAIALALRERKKEKDA